MSPEAGDAVKALYTPDAKGRIYCGQGAKTDEFEQEFHRQTGLWSDHLPLGVNSCTAAIDLALHCIGVGPGDEVATVAVTCAATHTSVINRGAKLVWVDVDPLTGLMQPDSLARVITSKTKAVIAVDWAGRHCDYLGLKTATNYRIPVIEDAAHCLTLPHDHGDWVAFSTGPIKHLTTGGYGGLLLTPPEQRKRVELLRWHGLDRHSNEDFRAGQNVTEAGYRYHMTDDQAVVGLANLDLAQQNVAIARMHAKYYSHAFANVRGVTMPAFDERCNYWLHGLIIAGDRDEFARRMQEQGIPTTRAHARNDRHDAFRRATVRQDGDLAATSFFDEHQTNLPGGSWLSQDEMDRVVTAVKTSVRAAVAV